MGDLLGSRRVAPHFFIFGLFYSAFALAAVYSIPPRVYFPARACQCGLANSGGVRGPKELGGQFRALISCFSNCFDALFIYTFLKPKIFIALGI